jgi:hypothetical protein
MPNCQQELPNRHKIHVDGELLERGLRTSHVIRRLLLAESQNENARSGGVELRSTEQLVMNQWTVVSCSAVFYSIVERMWNF